MRAIRNSRARVPAGIVLAAVSLFPAAVSAASIDVAARGTLVADDHGDALLFPLYTTANGAATAFSVTNTSPTRTVIAKIRFREQERSMDVLDFIVALSPNDKFDFVVNQPEDSRPVMRWNDNSCVVGPGAGTTSVEFPAPTAFVDSEDAMSLGHLEVIGMLDVTSACHETGTPDATCNSTDTSDVFLAPAALHGSDGVPADCSVIVNAFSSQAAANNIAGALDAPNVLIGRYLVTATGVGVEGGSNAISLRNTFTAPYLAAQSSERCNRASFTNLSCTGDGGGPLPDGGLWAWDDLEWDHPHLGDASFGAIEQGLQASRLQGDWSNNPANFVGVDWVIAFPTKYARLDTLNSDCQRGTAGSTWCFVDYSFPNPFSTNIAVTAPATNPAAADTCLSDNDISVWDKEEQAASGSVTVSPGARTTLDLCNETNVFTIAELGDTPRDSLIQTADRRDVITFENLPAVRGWADFRLNWISQLPGGAATIGLVFTTRATDDPTINNGSITDLARTVPALVNGTAAN